MFEYILIKTPFDSSSNRQIIVVDGSNEKSIGKIVEYDLGLIDLFNKLGRDGWELVIERENGSFIFKRSK